MMWNAAKLAAYVMVCFLVTACTVVNETPPTPTDAPSPVVALSTPTSYPTESRNGEVGFDVSIDVPNDSLPADGQTRIPITITASREEIFGQTIFLFASGGGRVEPEIVSVPRAGETVIAFYITGRSESVVRVEGSITFDQIRYTDTATFNIVMEPLNLTGWYGMTSWLASTDEASEPIPFVPLEFRITRSDGLPLTGLYPLRVSVLSQNGVLVDRLDLGSLPSGQAVSSLNTSSAEGQSLTSLYFVPQAGESATIVASLPGRADLAPLELTVYWTGLSSQVAFFEPTEPTARFFESGYAHHVWNLQGAAQLCARFRDNTNNAVSPRAAAVSCSVLLSDAPTEPHLYVRRLPVLPDVSYTTEAPIADGRPLFLPRDPTCITFDGGRGQGGILQFEATNALENANAVTDVLVHFGRVNLAALTVPIDVQFPTAEGQTFLTLAPNQGFFYLMRPFDQTTSTPILLPVWVHLAQADLETNSLMSGMDGTIELFLTSVTPLTSYRVGGTLQRFHILYDLDGRPVTQVVAAQEYVAAYLVGYISQLPVATE